jgi:hypothetical protein
LPAQAGGGFAVYTHAAVCGFALTIIIRDLQSSFQTGVPVSSLGK